MDMINRSIKICGQFFRYFASNIIDFSNDTHIIPTINLQELNFLLEKNIISDISKIIKSYLDIPSLIVPTNVQVNDNYWYTSYDAFDPITGYHKKNIMTLKTPANSPNCLMDLQFKAFFLVPNKNTNPIIIGNQLFLLVHHITSYNSYNLCYIDLDTYNTKFIDNIKGNVSLALLKDYIYIIGYQKQYNIFGLTEVIKIVDDKFVFVANTIYPRCCASVVTIGSHMFVIGGNNKFAYRTIEVFDGYEWKLLKIQLKNKHTKNIGNIVIIDYKIYIQTENRSIEVYDTLTNSITELKINLLISHYRHLFVFKKKLFLIGDYPDNNIYYYDEKLENWNVSPHNINILDASCIFEIIS
jgi:hypothetical protein